MVEIMFMFIEWNKGGGKKIRDDFTAIFKTVYFPQPSPARCKQSIWYTAKNHLLNKAI